MKLKKIFAALLVLGFSNASLAMTPCHSVLESGWENGAVGELPNAMQVLFHVKLSGNFMVADLICNFENCTGYRNGVEVLTGTIKLNANDSSKVDGFVVDGTEFVCK